MAIASFYFGFGFLSALNRHEVSMFVNARAIIERETTAGLQIVAQMRNKPHEGTKKIELPGGQVNEYESLIDALKR